MKTININTIIISIVSLVIGFSLAFLIWGTNSKAENPSSHDHSQEEISEGEEIWTCSMHPQIRANEPGDCPICGMDLIVLEANSSRDPLVLEMTEEAVKLANIQTTLVGASNLKKKSIRLSGKVQEDERLASSQVAHIPGRIEKLYVTFKGEQVNKGQKLVKIYSPELITAQRELFESQKLKNLNPDLLRAAKKKLEYWNIDTTTINSILNSNKIQETFTIYADKSGIVTNRRISVGDYVKVGEPLFELMSLNKVWVLFDVYEEDIPNIRLGDVIDFTTPSLPQHSFKSKISFIDPVINSESRTLSIRTEMNNYNNALKPEMLVYGVLTNLGSGKEKIIIPKSAILWTGKRSVVYTKEQDLETPSFKFKEIEIGESAGDGYEVISGLETGEEIVTNGNFAIDAAAQLNNQTSMMNRRVNEGEVRDGPTLPDYTEMTPKAFKDQIFNLIQAYLQLKDAFVATDSELAVEVSKKVLVSLSKVDMSLLKDQAHFYWMDQLAALEAHSKKITTLSDVVEQRKQFDFLSKAMINTIKVFGIPKDTFYVQHCPMAIGTEGADWISDQTKIRNPYFGDVMLKCGSVTDTISISGN